MWNILTNIKKLQIPGARLRQQLLWSYPADWAAGGRDQHHLGRGIVRQTGLLHTLQVTTQHQDPESKSQNHRKYGQKKSWHLVGFICVVISFPFIFMPCISCSTSDGWAQLIYYSAFAVVFQFGWASMQVSSSDPFNTSSQF